MSSIYIFGRSGRMGRNLIDIIHKRNDLSFAGGASSSKIDECEQAPDLVIDFSLPQGLEALVSFVQLHGCPLVSGTTGYTKEQFSALKDLSQTVPVFWSANMSFGVYLVCQLAKELGRHTHTYTYSMEETHHIHKKDKPSGTALMIEKATKTQNMKSIPIDSIREGEVFGEHRLFAQNPLELIEIRHKALDRSLFAQGALDVGLWLRSQKPGFYGMDDYDKARS